MEMVVPKYNSKSKQPNQPKVKSDNPIPTEEG